MNIEQLLIEKMPMGGILLQSLPTAIPANPAFPGGAGSHDSVNMVCKALVRRRVVMGDMSGSMSSGSFSELVEVSFLATIRSRGDMGWREQGD